MHFIFDLDGTLVDSLPGIAAALNASLNEHDLPSHSIAEIRTYIGDGSWMLCKNALPDATSEFTDSLEAGFKKNYAIEWKTGTLIYEGVEALLEQFPSGHHLSVLSNKPHQFTVEIVNTLFPAGTFQTICGQRQEIAKKPDPAGIHEILAHSGHEDKTAYLIGDSTVDISTANNAEIRSIAVTWGFEDLEAITPLNPTHIVHTVDELSTRISTL